MAPLKQKGDLAELKVAADLVDRGCSVSFPFGEDCDYDLIADKNGLLHRVQVKYTESDGRIVRVRCRSHSLTKGKIRRTKYYTAKTVDWIAVYDHTSDRCYYLPSTELGVNGRGDLTLRLTPARNGQRIGIRNALDYADPDLSHIPRAMEPAGLEPATSVVQGRRSSS
jgi:Holliday junction resolvase-like predicted endonuclease